MTESRVTQVQGAGTFNGQYGMLYKFQYTFEDGATLVANHKTDTPRFKVGDIAAYTVNGSRDGMAWGKVERAEGTGFTSSAIKPGGGKGRDQDQIARQWAVNAAINFLTSTSADPSKIDLRWVCATAKEMHTMSQDFDAYLEKSKGSDKNDDLPF